MNGVGGCCNAAARGVGQPLLEPVLFGRKLGERAQLRIAGLRAVACQAGTKGVDETQLERSTGARCTSKRRGVSIEGRNRSQLRALDP